LVLSITPSAPWQTKSGNFFVSNQPTRKPKLSPARNRRLAHKQANALSFEKLEARQLLATVTVSNTTDLINAPNVNSISALIASDGGDGISLREAIAASNSTSAADTIDFDPSVFSGGLDSLIRLTQGELVVVTSIFNTLTIDASMATEVTITGDADGDDITFPGTFITDVAASFDGTAGAATDLLDDNSRVLRVSSTSGDLTLNGLTLTGGRTTEDNLEGNFNFNDTTHSGGGIRFLSSGDLTLTNSTVSGNSTTGERASGGGIFSDGFSSDGNVFLLGSTVSENSTAGFRGYGGGVLAYGAVSLTNSTVSGNVTTGNGASGGGINARLGDVSLTNSTVSGNTVDRTANGGGIETRYGDVSLTNSTVSGNRIVGSATNFSGRGGGISGAGDITLTSSTVSGNTAAGIGGGIFQAGYSSSFVTIENSIVAGNTANLFDPDLRLSLGVATLTINHSLIGATDLTITGTGNQIGSTFSPIDPLLGPLADNGGPTQTHALLPGSPAIDAGNTTTESEDQRGLMRVVDLPDSTNAATSNGVDIGAFERQLDEPLQAPPVVTSFTRDEGGVLDRPDLLSTISVSFDLDVLVSAGDLIVRNDTTQGTVVDTLGVGFSYDMPSRTATWDFSSLPDLDAAFYSFELSDDIVSAVGNLSLDGDADGNPGAGYIESVYVALPGDANLDGQVNVLGDALLLVGNLGTTGGATWAQGDFNNDGNVNVLGDALILVGMLGQNVRPPVAVASFAAISSATTATLQSPPASTATVNPALLMDTSGDEDAALAIANKGKLTTPQSEALQLVLAGDHELRDDVFGSDF